jgi:hypothetical protein
MCHDDDFKDEQCMKREKFGSNTFVWVRKCKGAKVCVTLPYYGGIIGACSIKVRSHYDGEVCANGNKCTSGICDGTKCKGLNPGVECQVGLGQCKKGYLCRATANTDGSPTSIFKCQEPIKNKKECNNFSGISFSVSYSPSGYNSISSIYSNPAYNPCGINDVCSITPSSTTPICIEIGSLKKGNTASNPLACETGYIENNKCTDADSATNQYLKTSRGASFTEYSNITDAFEKWKTEWDKKDIKDEDAIYEAYRYTKNKKKINEAFFRYTHTPFVGDADECAFDYMWKNNSSNSLKFSLMILVLALLF